MPPALWKDRIYAVAPLMGMLASVATIGVSIFVPMIFQGEEWGASTPFQYFTSHPDAELGRAVTEGRRQEFAGFGWAADEIPDPQEESTWHASVLRWDEMAEAGHGELLTWYRQLLALRRSQPDLTEPRLETVAVRFDDDHGWLVVTRGRIHLAFNVGDEISVWVSEDGAELLVASDPAVESKGTHVHLPRDAVAVLRS